MRGSGTVSEIFFSYQKIVMIAARGNSENFGLEAI